MKNDPPPIFSVLLLDDDERFRKLVVPRLRRKGINVVEAGEGKQAQEMLGDPELKFDALIVDGVLPDTDGISWVTRYRASGGTRPIVYISAFWQTTETYQLLTGDLNVSQVIHKPVVPAVFADQIIAELTRPRWSPSFDQQKHEDASVESGAGKRIPDGRMTGGDDDKVGPADDPHVGGVGGDGPKADAAAAHLLEDLLKGKESNDAVAATSDDDDDDAAAFAIEEIGREYIESLPDELDKIANALLLAHHTNAGDRAQHLQAVRLGSHKLRGTAGTFGMNTLGILMGRVEDRIADLKEQYHDINEKMWSELTDVLSTCRHLVESNKTLTLAGQRADDAVATSPILSQRAVARILVVDDDFHFLDFVDKIASQRLIEVVRASTANEAIQVLGVKKVDAIILDLNLASEKSFELARAIRDQPGGEHIPFAFVSADASLTDRVTGAQMGASLYLNKPMDPDALEDAIQRLLLLGSHVRPRILLVDDDQFFTNRATAILLERGMDVKVLNEPSRILEVLHDVDPDILLLDLLMPGISGFDICKMLRTLPRWQGLPILFVTAQTGLETRIAAFKCGADDYLSKPISDEELVTRVSIRVERSRLFRERSERDAVTGLLVLRSFMERFTAQLNASRRQSAPISLIMFDLDKFKGINDNHGHLAGDAVLAGLGRLLSKRFRVEDLRGRWGGDEFILALVGSERKQSAMLMQAFLNEFTKLTFIGESGIEFQTALSAGVAAYPEDGETTYELLRISDLRLFQAKSSGRNCVVSESEIDLNSRDTKHGAANQDTLNTCSKSLDSKNPDFIDKSVGNHSQDKKKKTDD